MSPGRYEKKVWPSHVGGLSTFLGHVGALLGTYPTAANTLVSGSSSCRTMIVPGYFKQCSLEEPFGFVICCCHERANSIICYIIASMPQLASDLSYQLLLLYPNMIICDTGKARTFLSQSGLGEMAKI